MVNYLKNTLKRKLQDKEVFYQRLPSPNFIYNYLENEPDKVRFYELKEISKKLQSTNNHKYYNKLLKKFVPEWDVSIEAAEFIGSGIGRDGFNTYRRVRIEGDIFFEKIYTACKSNVIDKALWLQKNFYNRIDKSRLNVPPLKKYFKGSVIAIEYYSYIELPKIPSEKAEKPAIEIAKYLYTFSKKNPVSTFENLPDYLYDLQNIRRYNTRINQVGYSLSNNNIDYKKIENEIKKGRLVFTHLDIKGLNMFAENTLIDWDEFGLFPAGMEQANIYVRNILWYELERSTPLQWLRRHFKVLVCDEEWEVFQLSFLYFVYLFGLKFLQKSHYLNLKAGIIQNINNILNKS